MSVVDDIEEIEEQAIADAQKEDELGQYRDIFKATFAIANKTIGANLVSVKPLDPPRAALTYMDNYECSRPNRRDRRASDRRLTKKR